MHLSNCGKSDYAIQTTNQTSVVFSLRFDRTCHTYFISDYEIRIICQRWSLRRRQYDASYNSAYLFWWSFAKKVLKLQKRDTCAQKINFYCPKNLQEVFMKNCLNIQLKGHHHHMTSIFYLMSVIKCLTSGQKGHHHFFSNWHVVYCGRELDYCATREFLSFHEVKLPKS